MSKQIKILKTLLGTKLWNWLSNATQVGSIAENPSVMTASGWRVDKGKAKQDKLNNKGVKLLRNNISKIGEAGVTALEKPGLLMKKLPNFLVIMGRKL